MVERVAGRRQATQEPTASRIAPPVERASKAARHHDQEVTMEAAGEFAAEVGGVRLRLAVQVELDPEVVACVDHRDLDGKAGTVGVLNCAHELIPNVCADVRADREENVLLE